MLAVIARPDVQAKLHVHLHGPGNPFLDPEVRKRAHETNAARGWPQLRGGNGKGPTVPQQKLHALLGTGWQMELAISISPRLPGLPLFYKVDIGHQGLMAAIEVHGKGHGKRGTPEDHRKRDFLESRGWMVLWVWNEEILNDPSGTLRRLQATISRAGS